MKWGRQGGRERLGAVLREVRASRCSRRGRVLLGRAGVARRKDSKEKTLYGGVTQKHVRHGRWTLETAMSDL